MLEVRNLTIEVNNKTIISDLNFTLNENNKLAIIGEEGNGKSTLLKSIYNKDLITYGKVTGTINLKGNTIGYLEQSIDLKYLSYSVEEYIFENIPRSYDGNLYRIIKELNINKELLNSNSIDTLSGGEKVKIQLLKILLEDADILLLDEPTNDLDIETLKFLEDFINSTRKPIIFVSHDETLLSKTANMILHIELLKDKTVPKHTLSKNTYDEYVEKRLSCLNKETQLAKKEKAEYDKKIERLRRIRDKVDYRQETISRGDPFGAAILKRKMKSIKSQEKKLLNTELREVPDREDAINFFFENTSIPNMKEILKLHLDELKVENKVLSYNIELNIVGPKHVVILGENGTGKTTLIRKIYEILKNRKDIIVGYMPQNYEDVFKDYKKPLDFLCSTFDKEEVSRIRGYMGNMNITREEMVDDITNLSSGTKAKIFLLKFILEKCNVLILDEPTRNLSPLSNPVIRRVLREFNGTIISVSHDRKYIDEVCDTAYELNENGLIKLN